MKIARNHQPCRSPVSLDQVVPRLKPGGRKKLRDGFETQDTILLFRHFEGFTDKRKLLFQRTISFTLIIQDTEHAEMKLFFRLPGDDGKRKPSALSGKRDTIF